MLEEWEDVLERKIDEVLLGIAKGEKARHLQNAQLDLMFVYLAMKLKYQGNQMDGNLEEELRRLAEELRDFQEKQKEGYHTLLRGL